MGEDGQCIFGPGSLEALRVATGQTERNLKAWDVLFAAHGVIEKSWVQQS